MYHTEPVCQVCQAQRWDGRRRQGSYLIRLKREEKKKEERGQCLNGAVVALPGAKLFCTVFTEGEFARSDEQH